MPGATESVQWGDSHVYKVGGKMFAVARMDEGRFAGLSLKVSPDSFHILTRESGIIPAPYLARAGWVMVERLDILPDDQLRAYIGRSHALVAGKLPKKFRVVVLGKGEDQPGRRGASARVRTAP